MNTNDFARATKIRDELELNSESAALMSRLPGINAPAVYLERERMTKLVGIINASKFIKGDAVWSETHHSKVIYAIAMIVKMKESKFEELHDKKEALQMVSSLDLSDETINLISDYWDKIGAGCTILSQHEEPSISVSSSTEEDDEKTLSILKELQFMRQNSLSMPKISSLMFEQLKKVYPSINLDGDFSNVITDLEAKVNAKKGKAASTTLLLPEIVVDTTAPVEPTSTTETPAEPTSEKKTEEQPEKTPEEQFEEMKAALTADGWTIQPYTLTFDIAKLYGDNVKAFCAMKAGKNPIPFIVDIKGEMFTRSPKVIPIEVGANKTFKKLSAIALNDFKSLMRIANGRKPKKYFIDASDYDVEFIFDMYHGNDNLKNFRFIRAWARNLRTTAGDVYDHMTTAGFMAGLPSLYSKRVDKDTVQMIETATNKLYATVNFKDNKYVFETPKVEAA